MVRSSAHAASFIEPSGLSVASCHGYCASPCRPRRFPGPRPPCSSIEEASLKPSDKSGNRLRRNVTLGTRRTSVSLEDHVWEGLREICRREAVGIDMLCTEVAHRRLRSSMSSALRVFLLLYFRSLAETLEVQPPAGGPDGSGHLAAALLRFEAEERAAAEGGR